MLQPKIISVEAISNHMLLLVYDTKEIKLFNVKPYIKGEWYSQLQDESYFKAVMTDGWIVEWPNGQDIAPEELYEQSSNVSEDDLIAISAKHILKER